MKAAGRYLYSVARNRLVATLGRLCGFSDLADIEGWYLVHDNRIGSAESVTRLKYGEASEASNAGGRWQTRERLHAG